MAGVADALDFDRNLPASAATMDGTVVHIASPPENAAARGRTGSAIEHAVDRIEASAREGRLTDADIAMIDLERSLMQQAVGAMLAMEQPHEDKVGKPDPLIIPREAVEDYFRNRFDRSVVVTDYFQAVGGRSRQTVIFKLVGNTGMPRDLVLQRDHPGGISQHGVADEFPVLSLLAKSRLKSPRPLFLEVSSTALGAPFMVSERSPGKVAVPDYWNSPEDARLASQLAEQLAILHSIDYGPVQAGLKQTLSDGADWRAELERLEDSWNSQRHWPSVTVTAAFAWMRQQVGCIGADTAIVHNDTALHNVLVHDGEISALLDWELVHLGHPAEDLGYCRGFIEDMGSWDVFIDAYVAAGGKRFAPHLLDYFSLRAIIHLTTLLQLARSQFEKKATDDLNMAEVGASFMPKLTLRLAKVMNSILQAK
ncbi:MAG: phosphotransferase family protein [Steroidobacteraceae bacterium]